VFTKKERKTLCIFVVTVKTALSWTFWDILHRFLLGYR
jgi:hypothetical protein